MGGFTDSTNRFPFYGLEPKERMTKLKEHFLKFEQESSKAAIEHELRRCKDELVQAANVEPTGDDLLLKLGDGLIVEVTPKDFVKVLSHIKDVY